VIRVVAIVFLTVLLVVASVACVVLNENNRSLQSRLAAARAELMMTQRQLNDALANLRVATSDNRVLATAVRDATGTIGWRTRNAWDRLRAGMTPQQVETLLGSPPTRAPGIWYYPDTYGGRVYWVGADPDATVSRWEAPYNVR
jgi:hypothetical protein